MKTKASNIILTAVAALFVTITSFGTASAQQNSPDLAVNTNTYKTAIGLRAGTTSGLTIKHFTGQQHALEGILGVWNSGFSATLLMEQYATAFNTAGLNWYYGAGGHVAFDSGNNGFGNVGERRWDDRDADLGLGVDGIVGLEYKIKPIPFAISLDFKPFFEVDTNGAFWFAVDPGLGIKVAF